MELRIFTDGGARGNPGPAAIGVFCQAEGFEYSHELYIGHATNNVAEYTAVIEALKLLPVLQEKSGQQITRLNFFLDSQLVVCQINGTYKIKEPTLQQLNREIQSMLKECAFPYSFTHVPRAQNHQADKLVNHALDAQL